MYPDEFFKGVKEEFSVKVKHFIFWVVAWSILLYIIC